MWRFKNNPGCWSLPTLFETGSFVHCCVHHSSLPHECVGGSYCLCHFCCLFKCWAYRCTLLCTALYRFGDLNLYPHVCTSNTLLIEPLIWSQNFLSFQNYCPIVYTSTMFFLFKTFVFGYLLSFCSFGCPD